MNFMNHGCSHFLISDQDLLSISNSRNLLSAIMGGSEDSPIPAYQAFKGSRFDADPHLYSRIGATTSKKLVESFRVPVRSGRAWSVPQGHICRITTPEGPQVGDLNIWNLHNPRERFWASRTRQLHASHVTKYNRLWSCLPYLRPLVTITGDSLEHFGVDKAGARVHDLLGTRCDPYVNQMLSGQGFDYHCHSNLARAILPYGLTEFDVHDVLNVFQVTGLNKDGVFHATVSGETWRLLRILCRDRYFVCFIDLSGRGPLEMGLGQERWRGPHARMLSSTRN